MRANLFLLPSTYDTASLTPIEAGALKLPTLMTLGCPTAEIINDGISGLLAKEDDVFDWAEKMIWAIEHKEEMKNMKDVAYQEVFRTWDSVAEELREYYINICQKQCINGELRGANIN